MPDDISPIGWLVILCAAALGFGLVRFMLVARHDSERPPDPAPPSSPPTTAVEDRHTDA